MFTHTHTHTEHQRAQWAQRERVHAHYTIAYSSQKNLLVRQSGLTKTVFRLPRRIVPPISVCEISGMSITTLCVVSGLTSVVLASSQPRTFRANSIAATWRPRQMPRKGIFRSRAHLHARIFPSMPREPNPPGTRIPWPEQILPQASWNFVGSDFNVLSSKSPASTYCSEKHTHNSTKSPRQNPT